MPFIVSIVGYKKSGKTTLVEQMIPILKSKGYRFGVLKYTGEGLPEEPGGKTPRSSGRPGPKRWASAGTTILPCSKRGGTRPCRWTGWRPSSSPRQNWW